MPCRFNRNEFLLRIPIQSLRDLGRGVVVYPLAISDEILIPSPSGKTDILLVETSLSELTYSKA
jgi:hypothetical protein